jgi:GT2 family glycosyltransferase
VTYKVSCVIVTYNRLELLKQCIDSILNQTYKVDKLIVINNHSNDGTKNYIDNLNFPKILPINLPENLGGAGGFSVGIKKAVEETNCDLIWVMDDDTLPNASTLEKMIEAANKLSYDFGFLSSNVRLKNGEPFNIPTPDPFWSDKVQDNLVKLQSATFVSILFNRKIIEKIGLPISDFFIWLDDYEYTRRITKNYPSYFVTDSIVLHKTIAKSLPSILSDNDRINRYFYLYRNQVYTEKKYAGMRGVIKCYLGSLYTIINVLTSRTPRKLKKINTILKGIISGIVFNPKIKFTEKNN